MLRQKWSRGQVEARLANLPPCLIGMEACVGAHHLVGMRLFVEHALEMLAARKPEQAASMAKYHCAEQLQEIVAKGMRIMGGRAFFSFEQMSRYYCEAPFSLYAGGTVEIQKSLIARSMGIG